MKPQDRDARAKLKLCEKIIKEAAFAAAIQSERNLPLSETIDVNSMGKMNDSGDAVKEVLLPWLTNWWWK